MLTCSYCATELPSGAMFCGECGRAVVAVPVQPASVIVPAPLTRPTPEPQPWLSVSLPSTVGTRCEQCGARMSQDDIFCGECGFVSRSASTAFSRPRDTAVVTPVTPAPAESAEVTQRAPLAEPGPEAKDEPELDLGREPETELEPEPEYVEPEPEPEPAVPEPAVPEPAELIDPPSQTGTPVPFAEDLEQTRIVAQRRGERFVLQFSTGESFTVFGTGLIGRNPQPEPGEYFDQVIRVLDPSRSVSKTHLEFGQEAGAFWIQDRYSGNGTIIREPESAAMRCNPERRYRLARGSRVDLGEQFFIIS